MRGRYVAHARDHTVQIEWGDCFVAHDHGAALDALGNQRATPAVAVEQTCAYMYRVGAVAKIDVESAHVASLLIRIRGCCGVSTAVDRRCSALVGGELFLIQVLQDARDDMVHAA